MSLRSLLLLLVTVLAPALARAEIEFVGLLVTPQESNFSLTDKTTGQTVWRKIGQSFSGYDLTSYEASDDTLTLTKAGATTRVRLKDAKVRAARLQLAGTVTFGSGEKLEATRATFAFEQETALPFKDGVTWHITPTRMPDGNIMFRMLFDRAVQHGEVKSVEKLSSPSVVVRPGQAFSMKIGDLEFGFTASDVSP